MIVRTVKKVYSDTMIIYDSTTLAFIRKSEATLREILQEIGITPRRSKFLWKNYLYPIHVVVFQGKEWGHFNAPYMQIGLNQKLIYLAKDSVIRDILRHELAHYLTYIQHGNVGSHGAEFNAVCLQYGFPKSVSEATMNLEEANLSKEGDLHSEKIITKIKKLLMLAESSNVHEAELATLKANQLLLRHNIENLSDKEEPIYLDRLLVQKRKDQKMVAIYEILKHFIVRPVFSFGKDVCSLEVSGSFTNVTLAKYVAEFLSRELDFLWESAKKEHSLQGLRAKNSFFIGVAQGFDQKMKGVKSSFSTEEQKALVVVEKNLNQNVEMIYRRLSQSHSGAGVDGAAHAVGTEKGRNLNIRQGVTGQGKNLFLPS